MSDQEHIKDVLENAERFQRLFVQPLIDAVRTELQNSLQPLAENQAAQETRISTAESRIAALQSANKKALIGWSLYASVAAAALAASWDWLKSHLRLGGK